MKHLDLYFSDKRLVSILCRKRIEAARRARRTQFIYSVSSAPRTTLAVSELSAMLPPRRTWKKFRPTAEVRARTTTDAPTKLAQSMTCQVMKELARSTPRYRWVSRLRKFLCIVQQRAQNWTTADEFVFEDVYTFPKNRPGNGQKYRIVASYSLASSLICSGFAAYLRDRVDAVLNPAVLAFRSPPSGGGEPPCHHDAVAKIIEIVDTTATGADVWCAEADIEGFFDAVSHDVAMRETKRLLSWAGHPVDHRLFMFLESFLGGYDYVGSALGAATAKLAKIGITTPKFADPIKALQDRGLLNGAPGRIGIPQGSAMSCVLANIVISSADSLVCSHLEARGGKGEGLYLRYCDDIVIMHKRKEVCDEACSVYIAALGYLKLPYHPPKEVEEYPGSRMYPKEHPKGWFWAGKSKASYPLSASINGKSVPWLAFVGYQISRTGTVRVRKSSIDKELSKQRRVATDIVNELRAVARRKRRLKEIHLIQDVSVIQYRAMMHLLSIGVGYPPAWGTEPAPGAVSWSNGFRGMPRDRAVDEPLRQLDKGRVRVLRYLGWRLRVMIREGLLGVKPKAIGSSSNEAFRLSFPGPPFSYRHQFKP